MEPSWLNSLPAALPGPPRRSFSCRDPTWPAHRGSASLPGRSIDTAGPGHKGRPPAAPLSPCIHPGIDRALALSRGLLRV